jgi:hypothetical protein
MKTLSDANQTLSEIEEANRSIKGTTAEIASRARYRLRSAHYIDGDKWLPGDVDVKDVDERFPPEEGQTRSDRGTVVGAGTDHVIRWPTLEMVPLNAEAEHMLELERKRLDTNTASMNPVDDLPMEMDQHEKRYIPGFPGHRREIVPDGAPAKGR